MTLYCCCMCIATGGVSILLAPAGCRRTSAAAGIVVLVRPFSGQSHDAGPAAATSRPALLPAAGLPTGPVAVLESAELFAGTGKRRFGTGTGTGTRTRVRGGDGLCERGVFRSICEHAADSEATPERILAFSETVSWPCLMYPYPIVLLSALRPTLFVAGRPDRKMSSFLQ